MHKSMINLFVPDTFEGACASVLMHGYAKYHGYGISVRYYRGSCVKELYDLIDSIRIANEVNAALPRSRKIYILSSDGFPRKPIKELKKDYFNEIHKYGGKYLERLYSDMYRGCLISIVHSSAFTEWLNSPRVKLFFRLAIWGGRHKAENLTLDVTREAYARVGAEEFEQHFSDYLHEGKEKT